jgi:hypothetical protein
VAAHKSPTGVVYRTNSVLSFPPLIAFPMLRPQHTTSIAFGVGVGVGAAFPSLPFGSYITSRIYKEKIMIPSNHQISQV